MKAAGKVTCYIHTFPISGSILAPTRRWLSDFISAFIVSSADNFYRNAVSRVGERVVKNDDKDQAEDREFGSVIKRDRWGRDAGSGVSESERWGSLWGAARCDLRLNMRENSFPAP